MPKFFTFRKGNETRQRLAAAHLSTVGADSHHRRQEAIPMAYPVHTCRRKSHYPARVIAGECAFICRCRAPAARCPGQVVAHRAASGSPRRVRIWFL